MERGDGMTMGYIEDRIAKLEEIVNSLVEADGDTANALQNIWKEIAKLRKTADAEPIRLGHWEMGELETVGDDIYGGEFELQHHICSVCGHDNKAWASNYCPNCGAKMDEGTE